MNLFLLINIGFECFEKAAFPHKYQTLRKSYINVYISVSTGNNFNQKLGFYRFYYVYLGMHTNEELIHRLYTSLQQLDAEGMIACYHEEATFRDPVFILKSKQEISAMWTMLCAGARDFGLIFEQVQADENEGSAKLEANYKFSQTNRKVLNKINARFRFKDGLIIEHVDKFNFWKWSKQSLGMPGYLLGWSPFLKKKVRQRARQNMKRFEKGR